MKDLENLSKEVRYVLLTVIDNDGDIEELRKLGFTYFEIKDLIKGEINKGYAKFENDLLMLTNVGHDLKNELSIELNYTKMNKIIIPKISSKIQSIIPGDDIFIPSEDELTF